MVFWEAVFLGLIQGLTEFLPVSSTAHLILLEKFFHLSPESLGVSFDAALHLGTVLALVVYFWSDLCRLLSSLGSSFSRRQGSESESRLVLYLLTATVPAAVFGFLFEDQIETSFRDPRLIVVALLGGSGIFYLAERLGRRKTDLAKLGFGRSLILGLAQALALIPGISRSGVTISGGLLLGLRREAAGYFVFLMSIPIIFGAGLKGLLDAYKTGRLPDDGFNFLMGFLVAAVSGYFVVKYFLAFLGKHSLMIFIYYRVLLAFLLTLILR